VDTLIGCKKIIKTMLLMSGLCFFSLVPSSLTNAMSTYITGAHNVNVVQYADLTTNNPDIGKLAEGRRIALAVSDWSTGKPQRPDWYAPKMKISGKEISGYFDDCNFVIRVPDKWNGRLVIVGAPGFGDSRSTDALISDYVLTKVDKNGASYAYAICDKGTTGEQIPAPDGVIYPWAKAMNAFSNKEDSLSEWNQRFYQLTMASREVLKKMYNKEPEYTYLWGYSNGGYVTRYAMEHHPELYSGMIDWEGVLWRGHEENLISSLSTAVNAWQILKDQTASPQAKKLAAASLEKMGLPEQSNMLWPIYGTLYWLPTLNLHRVKYDPEYKNRNWWEFLSHSEDYKNYDWFKRPEAIKRITAIENTGKITKPTITIHGTWDALLFPNVHAVAYEKLVEKNGDIHMYRLYMVEHGNHFDSFVNNPKVDPKNTLQPLMPYVHQSFDALVNWVENGVPAPQSMTIGVPESKNKVFSIWDHSEIDMY
jgi:pimeloyl-ACP methyl ester carboxylesterase